MAVRAEETAASAPPEPDQLARSEAVIGRFGTALHWALASHDVLVCATAPITAPRIGELYVDLDDRSWPVELLLTRLTSPFNATGFPAISVPLASGGDLPVGLQVIGAAHHDGPVLQVARTVERLQREAT